jgi:hypothetical protein
MRRRGFLGLAATAVLLPGVGFLRTSAQGVDLEATVHALETQVSALQTQVAETEPDSATPPSSADVLFEADWSKGIGDWKGDFSWSVLNGMLITTYSDANNGAGTISAPFTVEPGSSFAVEAEMQYLDVIGEIGGLGLFGRAQREGMYCAGYFAGNQYAENQELFIKNLHGNDLFNPGNDDANVNFTVDNEWHTYRLEISGTNLRLFFDGRLAVEDQDAEFLEGTGVGVWSAQYQAIIRSFQVISL